MLSKSSSQAHNDDNRKVQLQVFSKESAFGKSWGKLGATRRNDAGSGLIAKKAAKQDLQAKLLMAINNEGNEDSAPAVTTDNDSHWSETEAAAVTNQSSANTDAITATLSPKDVMTVLWDHLELIADKYNTRAGGGALHVDFRRSISGTARATMSTSTHCLILVPDTDAVRLYVLPNELMTGMYSNGPQLEPNSVFLMHRSHNAVEWQTKAGLPLTMAVMNSTCRSLFHSMTEQSKARVARDQENAH